MRKAMMVVATLFGAFMIWSAAPASATPNYAPQDDICTYIVSDGHKTPAPSNAKKCPTDPDREEQLRQECIKKHNMWAMIAIIAYALAVFFAFVMGCILACL